MTPIIHIHPALVALLILGANLFAAFYVGKVVVRADRVLSGHHTMLGAVAHAIWLVLGRRGAKDFGKINKTYRERYQRSENHDEYAQVRSLAKNVALVCFSIAIMIGIDVALIVRDAFDNGAIDFSRQPSNVFWALLGVAIVGVIIAARKDEKHAKLYGGLDHSLRGALARSETERSQLSHTGEVPMGKESSTAIPPGSYTRETLPSLSPGARRILSELKKKRRSASCNQIIREKDVDLSKEPVIGIPLKNERVVGIHLKEKK